jgi:membrane fusion protein, macrolide-specific efflux system
VKSTYTTVAGIIAISFLAAVCLVGCFLIPEESDEHAFELPEPPKITQAATYPVSRELIMDVIEGSVRVSPVREVSLYFEVSGRVRSVGVEPGQEVSEGEVLAVLEIDDLEHSLRLSRIDLRIAEASIRRSEAQGAAPIDLEIQRLQVEKQRLAVAYLESKVAAATITAPFAGVVQRVQIRVSDVVKEYDPVIVLSDPTELGMQMLVNQDDFYEIDETLAAEIQAERDLWLPARIVQTTHINPRLDASVNREEYLVHLAFEDPTITLRLNDRRVGRIVLERRDDALVIPSAALREFGERTYVRVLDEGIRREVDVRVGIHTGTKVEIVEGLDEGELVIGK